MSFTEKVAHFEAVQTKYANFGASDSEPRWVFTNLLDKAFSGAPTSIPTSPEAWQLFSDMPGVDVVAVELAKAAEPAVQAAGEASEVNVWLNSRNWL